MEEKGKKQAGKKEPGCGAVPATAQLTPWEALGLGRRFIAGTWVWALTAPLLCQQVWAAGGRYDRG